MKRLNDRILELVTNEEGQAYAYGGGGLLFIVLLVVVLLLLFR